MALKIKRDDTVMVISGKDKGQSGRVLAVMHGRGKAIVEGVNMCKKHEKPRSQEDPGGIREQEAPINLSNLMLVDPKSGAPARFGTRVEGDGSKSRVLKLKDGKEVTV